MDLLIKLFVVHCNMPIPLKEVRAGKIKGNTFSMLCICGMRLMAVCCLFLKPVLLKGLRKGNKDFLCKFFDIG